MKLLVYISWPFINVDRGIIVYLNYRDEFTTGGNMSAEFNNCEMVGGCLPPFIVPKF